MNVLHSLARELVRFLEVDRPARGASPVQPGGASLQPVRERRVPAVLGLSRFRDGFEPLPGVAAVALRGPQRPAAAVLTALTRDGFEGGRRSLLDLSGGAVGTPPLSATTAARAGVPFAGAFSASLDDLLAL
jgi:hypothetical protein